MYVLNIYYVKSFDHPFYLNNLFAIINHFVFILCLIVIIQIHFDCGFNNHATPHNTTHIQTGEKPYECRFCNKRFTQNTILKTHMTLHTGKKIKCPDCNKLFSRASNLILHRREHVS